MDFRLLGPLEVFDGSARLAIAAGKQRALLAMLLLHSNRTVGREQIVDALWGEGVPESALKMVQIHVSQLRKALPEPRLHTRPPGYLLEVGEDELDLARFERAVAEARRALSEDRAGEARMLLGDALALWRGRALAEFSEPFARAEVPPEKPYGLGRQELLPLFGGSAAYRGGALELGVRGGDVVERLDWLLLGSTGVNGWPAGEALAATWRGWPVEVGAHLFGSEERPTRTEPVARRGNLLDLDRRGFEISASRGWRWSGGALNLAGRALWDQVSPVRRDVYLDHRVGSLAGAWAGFRRWGLWRVQPALWTHAESGWSGRRIGIRADSFARRECPRSAGRICRSEGTRTESAPPPSNPPA